MLAPDELKRHLSHALAEMTSRGEVRFRRCEVRPSVDIRLRSRPRKKPSRFRSDSGPSTSCWRVAVRG